MSQYDHLRESVSLAEEKVEIKLPHEDPVAAGKVVYKSGRVEYYYVLKNGAKMVYPTETKFRYQLRNQANVPDAKKVVDKLNAQLPTPKKGKKRESTDMSEYDHLRESVGLSEAGTSEAEANKIVGTIMRKAMDEIETKLKPSLRHVNPFTTRLDKLSNQYIGDVVASWKGNSR